MVNVIPHKYTVEVDHFGDVLYRKDGSWHRDGDKPASIWADGSVEYWKDNKLHRDGDLPAVVRVDGAAWHYRNGKRYEP